MGKDKEDFQEKMQPHQPLCYTKETGRGGDSPQKQVLSQLSRGKGPCWQACVRAKNIKAAGRGFSKGRLQAPWFGAWRQQQQAQQLCAKRQSPKPGCEEGSSLLPKPGKLLGNISAAQNPSPGLRSRKRRIRDSSGEDKEGARTEGRQYLGMGAGKSVVIPTKLEEGSPALGEEVGKETKWGQDTHAGSAWIVCSKVRWPQRRKIWVVILEEQTSEHLDLRTSGLWRTVGRLLSFASQSVSAAPRAGLPKDVHHLPGCTRGWPRQVG